MKLKMILSIIGVAIVAFIGFGLYNANGLKSIQIKKSVVVKGKQEEVFDMVRYLRNFPKWSPFLAQDSSQKYEIKGTDGTIGAQYHWNGNKGNDLGYQELIKVDANNYVLFKCAIQKPFVAEPTFEYTFKSTPSGIEVVQDFKLQSNLSSAFFMWLFGAKSAMEQTNQQGLDLLKKAVEQGL